jgi:hypothetical protein
MHDAVSIQTIQYQMAGFINDELKQIWYYPDDCLARIMQATKILVTAAGMPAEI